LKDSKGGILRMSGFMEIQVLEDAYEKLVEAAKKLGVTVDDVAVWCIKNHILTHGLTRGSNKKILEEK